MKIILCPKCKATLEVYDKEKTIICPRCGTLIQT